MRLYTATKLASMTVTTRQNYDKVMWTEIDQIATTTFATEKAKKEGKEEGKKEEKERFIKALREQGVSEDIIAKAAERK